ncbi:unnamed protein product [Closterium sp. NIES-65]|nr:unnamed protein product [Closterium sp. NIES-65]
MSATAHNDPPPVKNPFFEGGIREGEERSHSREPHCLPPTGSVMEGRGGRRGWGSMIGTPSRPQPTVAAAVAGHWQSGRVRGCDVGAWQSGGWGATEPQVRRDMGMSEASGAHDRATNEVCGARDGETSGAHYWQRDRLLDSARH